GDGDLVTLLRAERHDHEGGGGVRFLTILVADEGEEDLVVVLGGCVSDDGGGAGVEADWEPTVTVLEAMGGVLSWTWGSSGTVSQFRHRPGRLLPPSSARIA